MEEQEQEHTPMRYKILSPVLRWLLKSMVFSLRCMVWPVTSLRGLRSRTVCPAIASPLLLKSATQLAREIRTRQITCTEVVAAFVERVREVNGLVNAVVQDRFAEALDEAREIDELLAGERLTEDRLERTLPLLGVPITVKETVAVKGMSNNGAFSLVPQGHVAEEDAVVVRLVREKGAIPLLVSNTPELCMNWETDNPVTGRTNNPYDPRRTPGGSSGGEAALLGSAASVVGVASDICGSLRLPAMFTGVYGHKPTPGVVSNAGHRPTCGDPQWDSFFTLGPMCRYAVDLPLVLAAMAGEDGARQLGLHEQVDLRGVRVLYMEDDGSSCAYTGPVSPSVRAAVREAVAALAARGATVRQVSVQGLGDVINYAAFIMMRMRGVPNVFQKTEDDPDDWNSVCAAFAKRLFCLSRASAPCLMYGPLKRLVDSVPEEDFKRLLAKKRSLMEQFRDLLGDDGVFVYPTFPASAHLHGQIYYKFLDTAYCCLFNMLEMPATACPAGLDADGMPIGVQIAAWQNRDRLTLAAAGALESQFGGWIPPCATP